MSQPGWLQPDDDPAICRNCENADGCERDPVDCQGEEAERAAEERWEASRDVWD